MAVKIIHPAYVEIRKVALAWAHSEEQAASQAMVLVRHMARLGLLARQVPEFDNLVWERDCETSTEITSN